MGVWGGGGGRQEQPLHPLYKGKDYPWCHHCPELQKSASCPVITLTSERGSEAHEGNPSLPECSGPGFLSLLEWDPKLVPSGLITKDHKLCGLKQ